MAYVTETNDAVASTQTPYAISVGDYFVGYLAQNNEDWIEVTLTAGRTYTAAMAGLCTQSAAVSDTYLTLTQVAAGGTTNNATILLAGYTSSTDGAGAYAYFPGSTAASNAAGDL
ncbi:hypothetical protein [Marivivens donghaensis]|uniref:hypothetical protein n=1 Tax=Marivivens donghaensis TaxID=1699413 RepID=UPI003F69960D